MRRRDESSSFKSILRWGCVALLSLITATVLAWVAAKELIVRSELARADAIVVLAGSATYLERTDWASRLYKEGRAPVVILTSDNVHAGWSESEQRNPVFVELAAEELKRKGVSAEQIEVIPGVASNTHEEVLHLREYSISHNLRSILVITSPYHTRRALWTLRRIFEGSGVEIGIDSPRPGVQSPAPTTWWWYRLGWKMVPGEYLKLIYYRLKY